MTVGFKGSRRSVLDYFLWRKERALPAVEKVHQIKNLTNLKVLDIGCGFGSLLSILSDKGARVWGTETDIEKISLARKLLGNKHIEGIKRVTQDTLPFVNRYFDAVFLFDVIEHVDHPKNMISEAQRVLKPGGILYVEFTPYYSVSGHHLYDFFKLPYHLFLSQSLIKKIVFSRKVKSFISPLKYWNQYLSLNKLTISAFKKLISGFTKLQENYIVKYPEIFEINLPFLALNFPFRDLICMSFEGIYVKPILGLKTRNFSKYFTSSFLQRYLMSKFNQTIISILSQIFVKKVLDVGCGEGFILNTLSANSIGTAHTGIDIAIPAIATGKILFPNLKLRQGTVYSLPFRPKSFDLILCLEVLEHLTNPRSALQAIKRVSSNYILISTPNEPLFMVANLLRGKNILSFGNDIEHVNHWTKNTLIKFIEDSGLEVVSVMTPFPWTLILAKKSTPTSP